MRGQFIRGDGLVIPNNISQAGAAMILAAAFRNDVPTFYAGLVTGMPDATMTLGDMVEPTVGTNGYGRIAIPRNSTGWPTQALVGGLRMISTDWLTWTPTGAGFNQPIQRVALFGTNVVDSGNDIYALSAPLPAPVDLEAATPLGERQFKYQIFL